MSDAILADVRLPLLDTAAVPTEAPPLAPGALHTAGKHWARRRAATPATLGLRADATRARAGARRMPGAAGAPTHACIAAVQEALPGAAVALGKPSSCCRLEAGFWRAGRQRRRIAQNAAQWRAIRAWNTHGARRRAAHGPSCPASLVTRRPAAPHDRQHTVRRRSQLPPAAARQERTHHGCGTCTPAHVRAEVANQRQHKARRGLVREQTHRPKPRQQPISARARAQRALVRHHGASCGGCSRSVARGVVTLMSSC